MGTGKDCAGRSVSGAYWKTIGSMMHLKIDLYRIYKRNSIYSITLLIYHNHYAKNESTKTNQLLPKVR